MKLIPSSRGGSLIRFAIGAVIVIAFTATTTAVAGLLQFKQLAADLSQSPVINHANVTIANPGSPQTLLLIGSDHRAGMPFRSSNTDTMMLVRIDPNSSSINVLSVPRDLKVQIPQGAGSFTSKLNAAYSVGGPNLLVKVLKSQVLTGLDVNHIIDVNFGGFEALVNAIGCVYADVDHRYYNNTIYTNYSSIDVQPGYQKLCGTDALAFVRFRHTDSDIVRNARQQDFLRWAKAQYSTGSLVSNRDTLLKVFGHHTQTDADLHSLDGLINLFNLVAFSAGHAVKQIPFPADILPCNPQPGAQTPCFVTASPGPAHRAFQAFMSVTHDVAAPAAAAPKPAASGKPAPPPAGPPPGLIGDLNDGKTQAKAIGDPGFPVYVPRLIRTGSNYCTNASCSEGPSPNSYPRIYQIHDQNGAPHPAYRLTLVGNPALGQYYGVQGTSWRNPPILNSPTETRMVGGKQLLLYFNGHKLALVAWRTPAAVYWISNTLTDDIGNPQLIAMAASLAPAGH
jgi:LCP family protein required for cell wall assembly